MSSRPWPCTNIEFKYQIPNLKSQISNLLIASASLLLVAGLFYLPYVLDPQAARTGAYLGDRIGQGLLKNNLNGFLHFNSFYSSFYYVMLTGLLLLGWLAWAIAGRLGWSASPGTLWASGAGRHGCAGLMVRPDALRIRPGPGHLALWLNPAGRVLFGIQHSASAASWPG
jgi:hypothetical protein